jgi:hypothetical protein
MSADPARRTTCLPSHSSQTSLEVDLNTPRLSNTHHRRLPLALENLLQQIQLNLQSRFLRAPNKSLQRHRATDTNRASNRGQNAQRRASKDDILQKPEALAEILLCDLLPKQGDQRCCKNDQLAHEQRAREALFCVRNLTNVAEEIARKVIGAGADRPRAAYEKTHQHERRREHRGLCAYE